MSYSEYKEIKQNIISFNDIEIFLDSSPICTHLYDKDFNIFFCNKEALYFFGLNSKDDYYKGFRSLSPKYQPDGQASEEKRYKLLQEAYKIGHLRFEWIHQDLNGNPIPTIVTLNKVKLLNCSFIASYIHNIGNDLNKIDKLENADESLKLILESTPLCCEIWDKDLNIIDCNIEAVKLFQLSNKQEYIDRFYELSPEYQPDGSLSKDMMLKYLKTAYDKGRVDFEWMHQLLNGDRIPAEIVISRIESFNKSALISYTRDLRKYYDTLNKVCETEEITRAVIDAVPVSSTIWNSENKLIDCNQESVNLFELTSKKEYIDRFFELSPKYQPDGRLSREKVLEFIKKAFEVGKIRFEWLHNKINGEQIPSEITLVRVKYKNDYVVAGYIRDLREIKNTASLLTKIESMAFTDSLTGAYNRRYFMDVTQKVFLKYQINSRPIAIIIFDLDKFKAVNDTYGHSAGDEVLRQISKQVKNALRESDLFARYGGEEFIILVIDTNEELTLKLAARLKEIVANSIYRYMKSEIKITISLGVALKSSIQTTLEQLINNADKALYKAKENGRNRVEIFSKNN